MNDTSTTFRSAPEPEPVVAENKVTPKPEVNTTPLVDPLFTMYEQENKLPFTADYLDIKLTWDEADMVEDVQVIEDYLKGLVKSGEMGDTIKQAKEKLKNLEKFAGIDKIESQAQRIIKLSEFVKYLKSLETRKHDNVL